MIGRDYELTFLKQDYELKSSSILVLYGRRRIGKSYLIENYLESSKKKSFHFEGIEGQNSNFQIRSFYKKIIETFNLDREKIKTPQSWEDSLQLLTENLPKNNEKFIIYFDEFQWMASGRTALPALLKTFWDNKWNKKSLQLILCGSVSSYMIGKVIKSKALYGRIRSEISIDFLSIQESALFFKKEKSYLEIIKYLIIFGGIPKYLKDLDPSLSFEKNLEKLFFSSSSSYLNEFEKVFYSQFKEHKLYEKIVKLISKQPLNLDSISKKIDMKSGGGLKSYLTNLEKAQFVKGYYANPKSLKSKIINYRLSDPFLRFYLEFVEPNKHLIKESKNARNSMQNILKDKLNTFFGFGFENFCLIYALEIAQHLGIKDQVISYGPMNIENQAQIDLLYFLNDHTLQLVEIKFQQKEIETSIIVEIENKLSLLKEKYPKHSIVKSLISLSRPSKKLLLSEYFDKVLLVDDLLRRS